MIIKNKKLDVPIIQGGMGVGVSLSGLAGAVAACGACGVISSVNAGYREPDCLLIFLSLQRIRIHCAFRLYQAQEQPGFS